MSRQSAGEESSRDELSRLLIALRGERSQTDAAALSGLSQAKVSRAERGRFPMSAEQVAAYAAALGASRTQRTHAVELANAKLSQHVRGRVSLVRVAAAIQERIDGLERSATLVRGWQPAAIHGSLQTPAYTRALLEGDGGGDPGPAWWAARQRRLDKLTEPDRIWHLLMSEAALRWPVASHEVMTHQIKHLITTSELPNVRIAILDFAHPKTFAAPPGFHLYDRHTVTVATDVGTSFLDDPADLTHFEALTERLSGAAAHEDEARTLLHRIARDYRRAR